ncbi:unnamed protein product [Rotaria sp. Silwood2]|nr:unnamed protein product [Rotaria sp. Silwood2]CAF3067329.1 unnamed protein product [Rotaria sp. Silwood2]CAF3949719.1 unnamed protein product [Rotaria sp. Silwood2]CAF4027428.1 unnamed protein product [Rotaria sp. Silwood2]CAF4323462.1 unnamed protein product [Rotaria sp. Silwood2]
MAHHILNGNNNKSGSGRPASITLPTSKHITQENYDYELKKLMERERQLMATQQQLPKDNNVITSQKTPYIPSGDGLYRYVQQQQATSPIDQRVLPPTSATISANSLPVKPLRIIIIRHAERVDAVLGSDWSKKSFDRNGRYVRFSEHLPDVLPHRSYLHHYVIDVPLTNRGRMHAFKTGKALLLNGYGADICYTSPSLRCVQSANGILTGMGKKNVPMRLEPGLFECYLNDFKRTLCFMTKDELKTNGYNIDPSYQALIPFMRPHDSQIDYYERCRTFMDKITERHQATGGTILIAAHAPSLEGLTRHLTGGKFQPEKLFDIARRVPFLAMTIVEKNGINSPWLFRTRPLQTNSTQSLQELPFELISPSTPLGMIGNNHSMTPQGQQQIHRQQQQQQQKQNQQPSQIQTAAAYAKQNQQPPQIQTGATYTQQNQQPKQQTATSIENLQIKPPNGLIPIDLKKVVKSSTAPNLRMSNSLSEMFRVI